MFTKARDFYLDPIEEMLLIAAARDDHVRGVIRPGLAAGSWVLSDRFDDLTFALQVHGTGVTQDLFPAVNMAVVDGTRPDITFILDLPLPEALARRTTRGGDLTDPAEAMRDFERIRDGFRVLSVREPARCKLIDALRPETTMAGAVRRELRATRVLTD